MFKFYVKLDAIHKLGSSLIGCESFSIPGSITNGVSVWGRHLSVMKVLCNLGKSLKLPQGASSTSSRHKPRGTRL